jgi:hypothetical protein
MVRRALAVLLLCASVSYAADDMPRRVSLEPQSSTEPAADVVEAPSPVIATLAISGTLLTALVIIVAIVVSTPAPIRFGGGGGPPCQGCVG